MLLRAAAATDADAVTAVFLTSRAAAMPWLPRVHSDEETRGWIEHVVLTRRRQGIGTLLFRQAQETNAQGFSFAVFARNTPARAFYDRHGCRVVASGDGRDNEEREPDVTYEWAP